jgi:hypothetical protein
MDDVRLVQGLEPEQDAARVEPRRRRTHGAVPFHEVVEIAARVVESSAWTGEPSDRRRLWVSGDSAQQSSSTLLWARVQGRQQQQGRVRGAGSTHPRM